MLGMTNSVINKKGSKKRPVIPHRGSLERRSTAIGEPKAKTEQMYRCVRALSESVPEGNTQVDLLPLVV